MEFPRMAAGLFADPGTAAIEREVFEELAFHLELARQDLEATGCSREEAERLARKRFGDYESIRRDCMRARTGGNLTMKILLIVSNVLLLIALAAALLFMRALHARSDAALMESVAARAAYEQVRIALEQASRSAPAPVEEIRVAVGDTLELVDIHRQARFGSRSTVQADGKVLLESLGWVHAAGKSREELELELKDAYRKFHSEEEDLSVYVIVHKPQRP